MSDVISIAKQARKAAIELSGWTTIQKNALLRQMADALLRHEHEILKANQQDLDAAVKAGQTSALLDRLSLDSSRLAQMAQGMHDVAALADPVGETISEQVRPNGLVLKKVRVPMGVVGIIYESRPNVTTDAAALTLKTSNAVILKGGKEAIHTNMAIIAALREGGAQAGLPEGALNLIEDTSRDAANALMKADGLVDVLIPRGGAGLISAVVQNSTVPVIQTGTGNCHVFVDETADIHMGVDIIVNAKTSRPGVCNAAETLLVHEKIADRFYPAAFAALKEKGVELRGDERAQRFGAKPATQEDYATEFLDLILAVKTVKNVEEAIEHINRFGTRHSETIVTRSGENAEKFQRFVDAACVYANASTRFTDGFEFGLGAEIGISTQKLHARGPMGLAELTTYKYYIDGEGQIR